MKQLIRLFFFFFMLGAMHIHAQNGKVNKATKKYNQLDYIDATKVYLEVAESGFKSIELFKNLGDSYYFNSNYKEAAIWYKELFKLSETFDPIYLLRYSQSLKSNNENKEAALWFNKYAKKKLANNEFKTAEDYLQIISQDSSRYTIKSTSINSEGIEFGAGLKDEENGIYKKIVFATSYKGHNITSKTIINKWSGQPFLDLYQVSINEDGIIGEPTKLKGDVNTKYHESSAVFTKDGKTMYFTRNNTTPNSKRSKKDLLHLKIYRAHLINGKWTNIEDLSINGDNYSTAHPALNDKENKLYFTSDMSQTVGLTDLFMATINSDGSLEKPINLGKEINTIGRESFPFITKDNELYFSSDGHFGLGGYDVFYIKLKENGSFGSLLNVGRPINSQFDDFAFTIQNHKGFVSSNRMGHGFDDIYTFIENKDITKYQIYGVVIDKETKQPLSNASIKILDENNIELTKAYTNTKGYYQISINRSLSYIIKATKEHYKGEDKDIFSIENIKNKEFNFELTKNKIKLEEGDDIAKPLNIIVYFDLDKYNIRQDAEVQLQKIIAVLKQHPSINLDIRSHTDSKASNDYNMSLSNRRNNATIQYIINGGIDPGRLTGKGYGETQLTNACANGIKCTEELHQANRRSEFIIIKK